MPKNPTEKRTRNWTFTLPNYTEDELAALEGLLAAQPSVRCVAFGKEISPETGTPHLQGFIVFKAVKSLRSVKNIVGTRYHLENMRGSIAQNIDYCSKEGELQVFGDMPMTQKQKGAAGEEAYKEAWDLAKKGMVDSIQPGMLIRYYQTFKAIARDYQPKMKDLDQICNYWVYGTTGLGKSYHTRQKFGDRIFSKTPNIWWCGYRNEDVVLIDDFGKLHDKVGYYLKIWGDHYSFTAQVKGSSMVIRPKHIIVTSNYHPRDIWDDPGVYEPIERRFKIIHLTQAVGDNGIDWEGLPDPPPVRQPLADGFVVVSDSDSEHEVGAEESKGDEYSSEAESEPTVRVIEEVHSDNNSDVDEWRDTYDDMVIEYVDPSDEAKKEALVHGKK